MKSIVSRAMIERNEFRIGPTSLDWRTARISARGWRPVFGSGGFAALAEDGLSGAFSVWRADPGNRMRKRCYTTIDDALLRFGVVEAFTEARNLREYADAARLRCESLFGWHRGQWNVEVSLPPNGQRTLCCAYRILDREKWLAECRSAGDANPIIVPAAIAAINACASSVKGDGILVVLSQTGVVALLVHDDMPIAVCQSVTHEAQMQWTEDQIVAWLATQPIVSDAGAESWNVRLIDCSRWDETPRVRDLARNPS